MTNTATTPNSSSMATMSMMLDTDDDTSRAYASISAQLETWTSPKLGHAHSAATYEEDTDAWLQQTLAAPAAAAAANSPTLDDPTGGRGTPIMSNSVRNSASPFGGVVSPWIEHERVSTPFQLATTTDPHYRSHHDALWHHVQAKRNLSERTRLAREEASLSGRKAPDLRMLLKEEERGDFELLSALSSDTPLFSLLAKLRPLGVDVMLWDESSQHKMLVRQAVASLSDQKALTPAQLIHQFYSSSSAPLVLKRRNAILEWLQDWNAQSIDRMPLPKKTNAMWPESLEQLQLRSNSYHKVKTLHPDAPLLVKETATATATEPLYGTDNDQDKLLLKACLSYILAGRMDLAQHLCRKQGQPWRCAIWNGGVPHDITSVPNDETQQMMLVQVGNPARFLWKRQVAKLVKVASTDEEAAIYALLCNDMSSALVNPVLRTWHAGLYVCFNALKGRLEDELLQLAGKGKEYEACTFEQLKATMGVASLDEPGILETLAASPFEEMRTATSMQGAMASILVGKQALVRYCQSEVSANDDKANLRRFVHFVLYLDSVNELATPTVLEGMEEIKNQAVLNYLSYLATQPSLWRFMAIYASFLPTDTLLSVVPDLLTKIELEEERRTIATQFKELLNGSDVTILKSTVMLILAKGTSSDLSKCKSVKWLTHVQEHLDEALVCANAILRHFLIQQNIPMATTFIRVHLPDNVIANDDDDDDNHNARREFQALRFYLQAMEAFEQWKQVMLVTLPETKSKSFSRQSLTASDIEIADSMERRLFVEQKQEASRKVVESALTAELKLMEVLSFGGGWLLEADDEDEDAMDDEGDRDKLKREGEMEKLRSLCIPEVVFMLHNVCDETATWMESSLEDGVPRLGKTMKNVLSALDDFDGVLNPLYWIRRAKGFITVVASDENDICDAFGNHHMKQLNKLIQDIAIRELDLDE
jgi:nuclear pore complex protein Nup107